MKKILISTFASMLFLSVTTWAQQQTSTFEQKPPIPPSVEQKAVLMKAPEILNVVQTINQAEIQTAELAKKKTNTLDATVLEFAQQVERDHQNQNLALRNYEKMKSTHPAKSAFADRLKKEFQAETQKLKSVSEENFGQSYLAHEVGLHSKAMQIFEKDLIPNAPDQQLKSILEKALVELKMHYQKAELSLNQLNAKITKTE